MKRKVVAALFCLIVSACAAPPSKPIDAFVALPPKNIRFIMGEWGTETQKPNQMQHCTLAVIGGGYVPMLGEGCVIYAGCCMGQGLPLITVANGVYFEPAFKRTYKVQTDGSLLVQETNERLPSTPKGQSLAMDW